MIIHDRALLMQESLCLLSRNTHASVVYKINTNFSYYPPQLLKFVNRDAFHIFTCGDSFFRYISAGC